MGGTGFKGRGRLALVLIALPLLLIVAFAARSSRPGGPREELLGNRYLNHDLKLAITAPDRWTPTLGSRPAGDGLVVKLEPEGAEGIARPSVSVVRRTVPPGSPRDPAAYIRTHLLEGPKTLLDGPSPVGRGGAEVSYTLRSAPDPLRIRQRVYRIGDQAVILSASAPAGQYAAAQPAFERIFASLELEGIAP